MDEQPILVADDDTDIRAMVTQLLEAEGYPVVAVANGEEALAFVHQDHPALLVLDLAMPRLNGVEVAQQLRHEGYQLPIILMSANPHTLEWCQQIGADGCLEKPFDIEQLLGLVERHCAD